MFFAYILAFGILLRLGWRRRKFDKDTWASNFLSHQENKALGDKEGTP